MWCHFLRCHFPCAASASRQRASSTHRVLCAAGSRQGANWGRCTGVFAAAGALGAATLLAARGESKPSSCSWFGFGRKKRGDFKVCVCGGCGGIGQPLSLLLMQNPHVGELSVYDIPQAVVPPQGVAADLGHINKKAKVVGYTKQRDPRAKAVLRQCLMGCSLVVVSVGSPRNPWQNRSLLKVNAGIAQEIVEACAEFCPNAVVAIIVNPVNSVVPAMAEIYKQKNLDPRKIVGVTTLDVVRANKFVAESTGVDPELVEVPVIGGHAGVTALPLFSQARYARRIPASEIPALDLRVQNAGQDVVNAKGGHGSTTLCMAYAGARLCNAILEGLNGTPTTEYAYVRADIVRRVQFFTSKVTFGKSGVEYVHPLPRLSDYEARRLRQVVDVLETDIQSGLDFVLFRDLIDFLV